MTRHGPLCTADINKFFGESRIKSKNYKGSFGSSCQVPNFLTVQKLRVQLEVWPPRL